MLFLESVLTWGLVFIGLLAIMVLNKKIDARKEMRKAEQLDALMKSILNDQKAIRASLDRLEKALEAGRNEAER